MRLHAWILALVTCVLILAGTSLVNGEIWIVRTDVWGNPAFSTLTIEIERGVVSGDLDGNAVHGTLSHDGELTITSTDAQGRASHYMGHVQANRLAGNVDVPDTNNAAARVQHAFTAWRVPERSGGPRQYDYVPGDYSNTWNADRPPVLNIWPGDTVHTSTIDSGGVDERGVTRALFGNPQTGPFFVVGSVPGDTLVIHLLRLRLNRPYADSLDGIVTRALGATFPGASARGNPVRWTLDLAAGRARPAHADGALANFSLPVKPMLGGLGVAPGFGMPAMSTGDTGRFGGNMDFNEVIEGNTVYLPVQQPGALLYLGDGHALQGDGELTQYALETSMDVTFAIDVIKGHSIGMPRVESPTQLMVLGQAGSLDEALKAATAGMAQWLQQDYDLTPSQVAQVFGTAMHLTIPNLAGRNVGVAARIDKERLPRSKHVLTVSGGRN
jgi:amidase